MFGVPFDARRRRVTGSPIPLLDEVVIAAISASGSLIYLPGPPDVRTELTAVSLSGQRQPVSPLRRNFRHVRYAPDGRRVAVTISPDFIVGQVYRDGLAEVWVHDLGSGTLQPLTRGQNADRPEWTPDGRALLYRVEDDGSSLWRQPADASGPAELLQPNAFHASLTPDGTQLLLRPASTGGSAGNDVWIRSLTGDTTSRPLAASPTHDHSNPVVSPDGRWVAFPSNESGSWQIYVQPFPGPGPRYPVTVDGGDHAVWAPVGGTLYYSRGQALYEAVITESPSFNVTRRLLTEIPGMPVEPFYRTWDLAPDGTHFLVALPTASGEPVQAVVIHNWVADLRARTRTGPRNR
jgi:Tol biopolymer transport system component